MGCICQGENEDRPCLVLCPDSRSYPPLVWAASRRHSSIPFTRPRRRYNRWPLKTRREQARGGISEPGHSITTWTSPGQDAHLVEPSVALTVAAVVYHLCPLWATLCHVTSMTLGWPDAEMATARCGNALVVASSPHTSSPLSPHRSSHRPCVQAQPLCCPQRPRSSPCRAASTLASTGQSPRGAGSDPQPSTHTDVHLRDLLPLQDEAAQAPPGQGD